MSNCKLKLNVGFYILNVASLQSNTLVEGVLKPDNCEYVRDQVNVDIFHILTKLNDVSVDVCNEYFELVRVALRNKKLTSVPDEVWKLDDKFKEAFKKDFKNIHLFDNNTFLNASNLQPIKLLDLSCNYLSEISGEIKNLYYLQVLNLSNNELSFLPDELIELDHLEEVHLSNNRFQSLPDVLYKLKSLKFLFLKSNLLTKIDKQFQCLTQLEVLDVSQNHLHSWPYPVLTAKSLVELNLNHNMISMLPSQIHDLKTLKYLRLRHNQIRRLPKLHKMMSLEMAEFRNNCIENFPDLFGSIHLREIWLDNNKIETVDADNLIGTVITVLSISSNKLNEINGHFSLLDTLRYLDISDNQLETIPYDFCKLNKINVIKLDGNKFNDPNIVKYNNMGIYDFIEYLSDYQLDKIFTIPQGPRYYFIDKQTNKLWKSDNSLDCLKMTTDNTGNLPNWMFRRAEHDEILRLDLSSNRLAQLPTRLHKIAPFLEELFVADNFVDRLPVSIGQFTKLRILDLCSNHLSSLPHELIHCTELYCLNISSNKFEAIPDVVYMLQKLRVVFASNNKIKVVNYCLVKRFIKFDVSKNCIERFIMQEESEEDFK